ncbi:GDYXXLXY domain-containing protein [Pararhizobium sp. YC-54]|uniref:GDYXXLXY domain-containing protein n=1 Tax=Pararhizobium sp. YC-54 TaxID=2986920 RepID=UPI0021F773EA|nr:GDYXXLXY domain-containing protein [Pararhizobium sp. YC-54]MCV9997123.1 GDYXXLXY domain-containing protein [Pararhizobium sp. YC-54]
MNSNPLIRPLFAAILVALLQTAFLGYMIESRASILRNGVDVVLKTVPVDPRDLLRGDYVILAYNISTIPAGKVTGGFPTEATDAQLSVRLAKQPDGFWGVAEASFGALTANEGSVIARSAPFYFYPAADGQQSSLNVDYGIERYYVPEGEGKVLEEARNASALSVTARADDDGRMQIRLIAIDGKPLYEEPLY